MIRVLAVFSLALALILAAACGDDDDDDDTDQTEVDDGGESDAEDEATEEATIAPTPEIQEVEGNEVTDGSGDLLNLLSLEPASAFPDEIPADVSPAIDIQSATLTVEGGEVVMTMTLAGPVGEPADFTRGYDFAFKSEAFVSAERGAYIDATLIIGAERNAGAWGVIRKAGPEDPVPLEGGTVTVDGATVTIRVPAAEIIAAEFYEWRAIAWHNLTPEYTPADVAPDGPGFVRTPIAGATAGAEEAPPAATATP
jgi:hypothetical protein